VKLDGLRWGEHAKNFGLSGGTPGIVIEDRDNNKNFVFPESQTVTIDALRAHLQGFVDGTLAPTVKSEEIPAEEENSGPVRVIVGKSFDAEVIQSVDKDVLVEFYAPWCGHCKSLAPKYEKLGKIFENNPNVVIAKLDSTQNDVPVDVKGFPTIILFPAGDKTNHITFNGDRTEQALATWIRENGNSFKQGGADATQESAAPKSHEDL